jgi:predicted AlkP superfamily pyrophosphatase or phosphodiesterase
VLADSTRPELLALARAAGADAPPAQAPGAARDRVLIRLACTRLEAPDPPDLLLLRLSQTQPALALAGPDSSEADAAFASADAEVGEIVECLRRAERLQGTAIAVVGDHGTLPLHTVVAPNTLLARANLLRARSDGGMDAWSALVRSNGGSAFVYARDAEDALAARRLLESESQRTRAYRVVSAEEMLSLGADPEAWFGLEAEPGFGFTDDAQVSLLQPAAARAVGGYLPQRPEMNVGFVAWGPGIRSGVRIPSMSQSDVAPTLALLLAVDLGEVEGRPLIGALVGGGPHVR